MRPHRPDALAIAHEYPPELQIVRLEKEDLLEPA